ncbi:nucleolar complex protein 4 homolog [Polypterus senegalus]|uniref:nucleolar complex protein 4 homolog n=1 Tax=Polypterus senegalus TaxID=55291 RepID=UPI0019657E33|nr:nucleolar complex protein 4 homolog [Polypterus senegalus]
MCVVSLSSVSVKMAPSKKRNVAAQSETLKKRLAEKAESVLNNKRQANEVFDILEHLQVDREADVLSAIEACQKVFTVLLGRGELYTGLLPKEDETPESFSAEEKYKAWMRHRYNGCIEQLLDLLGHDAYCVKEAALCALMKFAEEEAKHPLSKTDWDEHSVFPRGLLKAVVDHLVSTEEDMSMLISRFQEYLAFEDVRYYVMTSLTSSVASVMQRKEKVLIYQNNAFALMSAIVMPSSNSEMTSFLVRQGDKLEDWNASKLKEHRRVFEKMWLTFLKHKLPSDMYKKVLVILHDAILPHMSSPKLMIDFLTAAYDIGGAISLLALNGLFVLINQHNLDYPDFYTKLYSLLEPSVFHVKYSARFFHLLDLFLSSSHLPAYLVAAFVKRLARLALTAPPQALLMVIPFIYNLIRRHPSCRVLLHRPTAGSCEDPYLMEEKNPTDCHALESSLWELQTLQKHYHPAVAKAAATIKKPLSDQEQDINVLLEVSAFEIFERDIKNVPQTIPLEFERVTTLLGRSNEVVGEHFAME